jgi:UDP-glucuronate 4-epimerase
MKILLTGSAGFIGFHLINGLIKRGDDVIGLDSVNDYYEQSLKYERLEQLGFTQFQISYNSLCQSTKHSNYRFIKLQLEDRENLNTLFQTEKFDAVCNLAAQAGVRYSLENPIAYMDSNIVDFINLLEACRHYGVNNLSYASSSSVYGLNESYPFFTSDNVNHPVSLYAASIS